MKGSVSTKQNQKWSIGRANWMQFQRKSKITSRVGNQNTIEEAHSCLINTILQAAEKKTSAKTKKSPPVA